MFVYRLENRTGIGPYRSYSRISESIADAHLDPKDYPSLFLDCFGKETWVVPEFRSYYACFTSAEDLATWFKGWFDALIQDGFIVKVYNVDQVVEGAKQAAFMKDKSVLVDELPIPDFLAMI